MTDALKMGMNGVLSKLAEGEAWNRRMANQCRKLSVRGWGRWHDAECCGDFEARCCLEKILQDNCEFIPTLDLKLANDAEKMSLESFADFKEHHKIWMTKEVSLETLLNTCINESRSCNIQLYEKLCCLLKEVQNECMRVKWVCDRMELSGWNGHDLGIVSMMMHKYFECEYHQGDLIDFNLG